MGETIIGGRHGGRAGPLSVLFLASGGPGNLAAAFGLQDRRPDLVKVDLVMTDRPGTPSAYLASARGCALRQFDYAAFAPDLPQPRRSDLFNRELYRAVRASEDAQGHRFDLLVLAYRRLISGELHAYFRDRAINQHPADLAVLNADGSRAYTGIGGLKRHLRDGARATRTSTILVAAEADEGEILCQGPSLPLSGRPITDDREVVAIEAAQKAHSDWASLTFALMAIASGSLSISSSDRHDARCRVLSYKGLPLPYEGYSVNSSFPDECIEDRHAS